MTSDLPPDLRPGLPPDLSELLRSARRATLATIRPDGRPRLVPVCFVALWRGDSADRPVVWSAIDEKPKRLADPRALARVRDIAARPQVELLVDRWEEDWARLAWVRLDGTASTEEPGARPADRAAAIDALRAKYAQYRAQRLDDRPLLRIDVERVSWWRASDRLRP